MNGEDALHREANGWIGELLGTLSARQDEAMLELGAGGELLVARLRAALSALLLLLPLAGALSGADVGETVIGLGAAVFVNVMAQVWLVLARNRRRHAWLPYATGAYDVTMTTGVLALLSLGDRVAGVNSMVVWSFYLIAIAMTALRHDGRLTLFAGGLALVQYAALVLVRRVVENNEVLGSIYLRGEYELAKHLQNYAAIMGGVLAISMVAALLMWLWLQSTVTAPILAMREVAPDLGNNTRA